MCGIPPATVLEFRNRGNPVFLWPDDPFSPALSGPDNGWGTVGRPAFGH
jgi:hypothetical protein